VTTGTAILLIGIESPKSGDYWIWPPEPRLYFPIAGMSHTCSHSSYRETTLFAITTSFSKPEALFSLP